MSLSKRITAMIVAAVFTFSFVMIYPIWGIAVNAAGVRGVVVIDPGHDAGDPGAIVGTTEERYLNAELSYKVAKELQNRNYNVTFSHTINYATEVPQDIPYLLGPQSTKYDILTQLVPAINTKNPDITISIHQNSAGNNTSANGFEAYWRSNGTPAQNHQKSKDLATYITNECKKLNYIRPRPNTVQDSMFLICKTNMPTILFEAGFMTNPTELQNLSDPSKQQQMAVKIVDGIDNYFRQYPSENRPPDVPATAENVQVSMPDDRSCIFTVIASGVHSEHGVSKVKFPTFIPGQKDAVWYDGVNIGNDTWAFTYNAENLSGNYRTDVYVIDNYGYESGVGSASTTVTNNASAQSNVLYSTMNDSEQSGFTVIAQNLTQADGDDAVKFPLFAPNGDGPTWYDARYLGANTWAYSFNISDYENQTGVYVNHIYKYINNSANTNPLVGVVQTNILAPTASGVEIVNKDNAAGSFRVKVNNVTSPAAITNVKIPVWCDPNQNDLIWYEAQYNAADNTWFTDVNIANHKYHTGVYQVNVYAIDSRGVMTLVANTTTDITQSQMPEVVVSSSSDQSEFTVTAYNVPSSATNVFFPTWSDENGQDDIIWYNGQKTNPTTWTATVKVKDHKSSTGTYQTHVYATINGQDTFLTGSSFEVVPIIASSVSVVNKDESHGTFRVEVKGVSSPASITGVKIPVWCAPDQSDIIWYNAKFDASSNTWYTDVNISDHSDHLGNYQIHVYANDTRGVESFVGNTSTAMNQIPNVSLSLTPNAEQSTYTATIYNVPSNATEVSFPTWSDVNGQDDIIWYSGQKTSNTTYSAQIQIKDHKNSTGTYQTHAYATINGQSILLANTSFEVTPITAQSVSVVNKDDNNGSFRVQVKGLSSPALVTEVNIPVWCAADQSDIVWYPATFDSANNLWYTDVNIKNHQGNAGIYQIHAYAKDTRGLECLVGSTTTKMSVPSSPLLFFQENADQSQFTAKLLYAPSNVTSVSFPTWSEINGQDDIIWYQGTKIGTNAWMATIPVQNHKNSFGTYRTDAYATINGQQTCLTSSTFYVQPPTASSVSIENLNNDAGTFTVKVSNVTSPAGITKVEIPVWCSADQSDIYWYQAEYVGANTWIANVNIANHQRHAGTYQIHAYAYDSRGISNLVGNTTVQITGLHDIMGATATSVDQMVRYFQNSGAVYPDYYKTHGGAPDIQTFCTIYYQEALAEGVKPEVAFAQAMKETGFLRFGGDVKIEQFNFAGMGATGGGAQGASFADVRTGVRAQIQHLKAYASTAPLNQNCVDPRFQYVKRGSAPYVEWLGIQENPQGVGWATAKNYGYDIVNMMQKLLNS